MADKEQDILRDAMIETDKEIFGDAFGQESTVLDDTGDRSLEDMGDGLEGQHEPDEDDGEAGEEDDEAAETAEAKAKAEADAKAAAEAGKAPKPGEAQAEPQGRVPAGRLREQTERTRAAETERDALKARLEAAEADRRKEIDALRAEFNGRLAQFQPRPADQPKPADPAKPAGPPDLFEDSKGFADHLVNSVKAEIAAVQNQAREDRINFSMETAKTRHGEIFNKAFATLKGLAQEGSADNRALVQRLTAAPNPGEAVVAWYKRAETLREVGDDPAAYKAKIAEDTRKALMADPEFRKQLLADLRAEALTGDDGRPRTATRLPPSLNRTTGGNGRAPNDLEAFDDSPGAIFDSAFT